MKLELMNGFPHKPLLSVLSLIFLAGIAASANAQTDKLDSQTRLEFWNNPEFVKRFMAGYGFNTEIEPKFENPEEQVQYRELGEVMRENPARAIEQLSRMITPSSSALLPFTLGALYFQEGEPVKAIEQYDLALTKFPDFRRAHRNLGFALAQEGR